ncbi:DsrE family protein [Rhodoferax sp.]|uniref:DsrE family protein n=1 Tax=Rhodoferax sp. TaxID=50421 RepID=UPI0025E226AE|nr:DsrE family protein [Rhodoferax sp.]
MNRRTLFLAVAMTGATLLATGCASTPPAPAPRIVMQVSDGDAAKWNLALNVANNAQKELGADKIQVEIVAFGPGIGMLKFDAVTVNRVNDAIKAGVKVVACENTMGAQKLVKADMNPDISYVPAGVIQIMNRQQQGWAYVRP